MLSSRRCAGRRSRRAAGGATNECKGIRPASACPGRGCSCRPADGQYLLSCPNGNGVVGGLDAQATSSNVRVSFDGQLGAPVLPGSTTTQTPSSTRSRCARTEAFQPFLGCVRRGGGRPLDGLARACPQAGPALRSTARRRRPAAGLVRSASVRCPPASGSPGRGARWRSGRRSPPISPRRRRRAAAGRRRKGKATVTALGHRRAVARCARGRPGRRGVRAVDASVALSPARAARRAGGGRCWRSGSSGGGPATRSSSRTSTCWPPSSTQGVGLSALGAARAVPARARLRLRRACPAARRRQRAGSATPRSCCSSTSRARCGRRTSSRRGSAPPSRR